MRVHIIPVVVACLMRGAQGPAPVAADPPNATSAFTGGATSSCQGSRTEAAAQDGKKDTQVEAVRGLLTRLLPQHVHLFHLGVGLKCREGDCACFEVKVADGRVNVVGTTGVEIASGVYWFLKYGCKSSVSWERTGGNAIDQACFSPEGLRAAAERNPDMYGGRAVPWSYYQNVVTVSYSMTWWDWERWEREIDWMALNGINLPLAFTGQEKVWQKVFARWNISAEEMREHFSGPSFLAWQRMGNLRAYGGPLPQSWIDQQASLQKRIVGRMREFCMKPVLPAFAGFVPPQLAERVPGAKISPLPNWGHFPDSFCCMPLLDPLDPLFVEIGAAFVTAVREEFGGEEGGGFYAADTFNEMEPPTSDPAYLTAASAAVFKAMSSADADATWLMQGWLFFSEKDFWQGPQIEALINGVPRGKLMILDLYADVAPVWQRTASFYGAPFIWCMLHNFGGNQEMYGVLETLAKGPAKALHSAECNMVGVGMCPEGIETNPVVYDFMAEWAFRREAVDNTEQWVDAYVVRRYGPKTPPPAVVAWRALRESVYDATDGHTDHNCDIPISRPGLSPYELGSLWGLRPKLWYDPRKVVHAWHLLLQSGHILAGLETFTYDLVDVGRQVMSKVGTDLWLEVVEAYRLGKDMQLREVSASFLQYLGDLDTLLSTSRGFLFGPWVEDAKAAADSAPQREQFVWNLKTQVTVWGTSDAGGSEVEDYANRELAGLVLGYYLPRWAMWLDVLQDSLATGTPYDAARWRSQVLNFTSWWAFQPDSYATEPRGDAIAVSQRLYDKYGGEYWQTRPAAT